MAKRQVGTDGAEAIIKVERDTTAQPVICDISSVAFLGKDYQATIFALIPAVKSLTMTNDGKTVGAKEVDLDTVYRETANIRLSPVAAAHLALSLLNALNMAKDASLSDVINNLDKLRATMPTKEVLQ